MNKNVGGWDRIARLIVGPLLILAGAAAYAGMIRVAFGPVPQTLGSIVLVLLGAVLLYTGAVQKCHINKWLGIDTSQ